MDPRAETDSGGCGYLGLLCMQYKSCAMLDCSVKGTEAELAFFVQNKIQGTTSHYTKKGNCVCNT